MSKLENFGINESNIPAFSIILATYNRISCVCNAIDSILQQAYDNFELIVVDDGSTDKTYDFIANKYAEHISNKKITLLKQKNTGVAKARTKGLKYAKNNWIVYFDSDNTMDVNYLAIYAYHIMKYRTYHCFYSKIHCINLDKTVGHEFNYNKLLNSNYIDTNVICHDRFLLNKYGIFNNKYNGAEDWELMIRYCKDYAPKFIDLALVEYNDANDVTRLSMKENKFNDNRICIHKKYQSEKIKNSITVILTSYNHEKYITAALDSALNQVGDFKYELIVSDDGSTDNTLRLIDETIKKHKNKKINVVNLSHDKNMGLTENLRMCVEQATGYYIAILEGDDVWTSDTKLQKQLDFLNSHDDVFMCFSKLMLYIEKEQKYYDVQRQKNLPLKLNGSDILQADYGNPIINLSTCMFTANILRTCPSFQDVLVPPSELEFALYFENFGYIGFIDEVMSYYRIHSNGQWSGLSDSKKHEYSLNSVQQCINVCRDKYKELVPLKCKI